MKGRSAVVVALGFVGAAGALSCSSTSPSFVIGVSSQMRVPKDLQSVRVVAKSGSTTTCESFAVDSPSGLLPHAVTISGAAGQAADVTVAGFSGAISTLPSDPCATGGALVTRKANATFVDGQSLYLPMPLRYLCENISCSDDQSCFAGVCASDQIDTSKLTAYSDPLLFGDTSYCLSNGNCLNNRSPVLLSDPDNCTFTFAIDDVAFDNQGVNIELVHDNFEREVIDIGDAQEGFSVDPKKTKQFTLAPALCDLVKKGKITVVSAGVGCPAKTSLNPLCDAAHDHDDGRPKELPTTCTSSADVAPTPNALYFLLDRSQSMSAYYTEASGSLGQQLDLVLQSPLLRTTSVAMKLLPASAAECTTSTSAFATPDIPFALANTSHAAIAAQLVPANVLANDPPLFLDGVLRPTGAYAAFQNFAADTTNARELIVIGNRDFAAECSPAFGQPNNLAFVEHQNFGISTGAILLAPTPTTDQEARDPYVDAVAMSRAGFGVFADGSTSTAAAAINVLGAFDSLESCVYDLPTGADTSNLPASFLTYFDVVVQNRIDIPYNAQCTDGLSPVDGWNLQGSRVRVCGAPCVAIKYVLDTSGLYAIMNNAAPPLVPFRFSPLCTRAP